MHCSTDSRYRHPSTVQRKRNTVHLKWKNTKLIHRKLQSSQKERSTTNILINVRYEVTNLIFKISKLVTCFSHRFLSPINWRTLHPKMSAEKLCEGITVKMGRCTFCYTKSNQMQNYIQSLLLETTLPSKKINISHSSPLGFVIKARSYHVWRKPSTKLATNNRKTMCRFTSQILRKILLVSLKRRLRLFVKWVNLQWQLYRLGEECKDDEWRWAMDK